jgi:ribosomal protein S18 acetylase RimI-like enzyme
MRAADEPSVPLTSADSHSTDPVAISLRQITEAWRVMCCGSPRYARHLSDAAEYTFSGLPVGFFNIALLTGRDISGDALAQQAQAAAAWSADKQVPWLLLTTRETLGPGVDASAVLDCCGFAPVMPLTGMIARSIVPQTRATSDLELKVPELESELGALMDINGVAYGTPLDDAKALLAQPAFWDGHVPALGVADGKPASCAAVLMADGLRYVAMVATDPACQRRGFGEATMRHALDVAGKRYGNVPSVLHATEAGRPIYERMGYQHIASHTAFMQKSFLH